MRFFVSVRQDSSSGYLCNVQQTALILANGAFGTVHGKTAHGLIRGSERFRVVGVVDPENAGRDAGELLDGIHRGIPVFETIGAALKDLESTPEWCVVGIATHGGALTEELRRLLREAARRGMNLVNGLHEYASDDPSIVRAARSSGARIVDLRKPKPKEELHFWTGEVASCRAPRVAVLGMDCAIGKRTTTKLLLDSLRKAGIKAEMIYTGQTGWMLGAEYGFVLDSVVNDFVSGELEHAVLSCDREKSPDVILIEGQSSLRNPCGPCGSEILLSAAARAVVLQHAPGREYFEGYESQRIRIPPLEEEIELIGYYGAGVLAVTLNREGLSAAELERHRAELEAKLGIPVVDPLRDVGRLVPEVEKYIRGETSGKTGR